MILDILVGIIAVAAFLISYREVSHRFTGWESSQQVSKRLSVLGSNVQNVKIKVEHRESLFDTLMKRLDVVKKLFNMSESKMDELRSSLLQAGIRDKTAVNDFLVKDVGYAIIYAIAFLAGAILADNFEIMEVPYFAKLLSPFAGAYLGHMMNWNDIKSAAVKRRFAALDGLPDVLDLLVICTEAGMSLDMAFKRVSKELMASHPILADELGYTLLEQRILGNRELAYKNLENRLKIDEIQVILGSILQSAEYGSPIGTTLRSLSEEFRLKRMRSAESRAARLPAMMTLPIMGFILPTLFIILLGPIVAKNFTGS